MSVRLKILSGEKNRIIECNEGDNLLELLRENSFDIDTPCGGNGRCGKCRVKINGREALACKSRVEEDAEIEIAFTAGNYINEDDRPEKLNEIRPGDEFAAAVDLGTTTITAAIINLRNGSLCGRASCMNHQKAFGADVISRIDAALSGRAASLRDAVQKDIISLLEKAASETAIERSQIRKTVISANTTMVHLLMGWNTEGLAAAPFKPFRIGYSEMDFEEVFGASEAFNAEVIILPAASAFVGADIISGIYAVGMQEKEEISAFIDLGTNAEMAVGNRDGIFLTSTAAGPAFEGGNISMGMAGVEGAVSDVSINAADGKISVKVIGGGEAKGICGTGLISGTAEMLRSGIVEENGSLAADYAETGFVVSESSVRKIRISQEDLHNLLLAKAAVAAGLKTLLEKAGRSYSDISSLYMAGSFAEYLRTEDAVRIGLIPSELKEKTITTGNSSLKGAIKFLNDPDGAKKDIQKIISLCRIVELSETDSFEKNFIDSMTYRQ